MYIHVSYIFNCSIAFLKRYIVRFSRLVSLNCLSCRVVLVIHVCKTNDHRDAYIYCASPLYNLLQSFPQALHSDKPGGGYMTDIVQPSSEAILSWCSSPLKVSRDPFSHPTRARVHFRRSTTGPICGFSCIFIYIQYVYYLMLFV